MLFKDDLSGQVSFFYCTQVYIGSCSLFSQPFFVLLSIDLQPSVFHSCFIFFCLCVFHIVQILFILFMGEVVEGCRLMGYGCPCFPYGGACYFMDFFVFDFSGSFCRRAFSPAPVSPFDIPAPASLDTKAPMIPCMAIRLLPLSLHFFASFSYFSASMLLFSFLAFSALFLPVSLLPYNLKREQLILLPSPW